MYCLYLDLAFQSKTIENPSARTSVHTSTVNPVALAASIVIVTEEESFLVSEDDTTLLSLPLISTSLKHIGIL
jgi:hypothetical protein